MREIVDIIFNNPVDVTLDLRDIVEAEYESIGLNQLVRLRLNEDARKLSSKSSNLLLSLIHIFMVIGPLLARFGIAYLPKPGGDKIGRRRLDTHLIGFQKLGAKFDYDFDNNYFALRSDGLRGTYMLLDEASVTGTANIVMAAVLARG